ncbi:MULTISPECIES: helix-turn-helix domain-containing protein [unclassified Bacteroides]|jgi:excisionase family DNA binding protein|uniref:helix-turn-helix domain-containing protein n=1 Tax=unclassified Bacteroides TaxID=2646097 RepID=UPI000E9B8988|nr:MULTISPECIES: helix-turn-helix domain-containing protein [unclassified Bacteroides]RGN43960.1 DNA-binding protein [Bacteroides sp. OM05-12]RHR71446.1 DNA-binding protein [Bacteroides sp. AF16-49]
MERLNAEGLNTLLTRSTPQIAAFFDSIDRMLDQIEKLSKKGRPPLNGERYLTDRELSERLKISRRALQDYRSEGKIPYYQIGTKVLYKESDIEKMLKDNYRKAFK